MNSSDDNDFEETPVIEILDLDDFILWIRQQSLNLALIQIGKNFFSDPEKYIGKWPEPEQEDLSDDDVFDVMIPHVFGDGDDENKDKFYILSEDAQAILGEVTNKLIYVMLNKLVDDGVLEMCWNSETDDFMWRVSLK